jgi:hypothetical protein
LNKILLLVCLMFPFSCYAYSGDLPREFAKFADDKLVEIGECKDAKECLDNRRVLFSELADGFHLTFYSVKDVKKIQLLIAVMVEKYEMDGVNVKMSLSFSREKHMPNQGFLTFKQRKQPFVYFAIDQGS